MLRKRCGYHTQDMLAQALRTQYGFKTDRPMISKWETGYQIPEMHTLKCLSELFGVSMDYLSGKEEKPAVGFDSRLSEKKRAAIEKIKTLDDSQVEALNQIIDSIFQMRGKQKD